MLLHAGPTTAQQTPSYARQVKPFLTTYCVECHNTQRTKGDLSLETFKEIEAGGENGAVLLAGKPDESRLVLTVEGKVKPHMPPRRARQPRPEEVAVLRAWVAAGARDDSSTLTITLPDIKPRVPVQAPVACLAYRPDGQLLAAGGHKEVALINVGSGEVMGKLPGQIGEVTALAFSPDGRHLAVAGGSVGTAGEVRLYPVPGDRPEQVLAAHKDLIHHLAFSPDGKVLATCGYDRLVKLWDVAAGKEPRTLRDHSDAVYGLAFSPDGRLLATAAADRAVKVWDVASGTRLYTLGQATDWLYAVAWSPDGVHLAAGGVDKSIRVWQADAAGARLVHSVFAGEGAITRLVYSADGTTLYSASEDRHVKAWETGRMVERVVYPQQPEAVLALALRPDQKQLALGRYDGIALLLDAATGAVQAEPLPVKPRPPQLHKVAPAWGPRGRAVRIAFEGKYLDAATELIASHPGVTARFLVESSQPNRLHADVTFPADTPAGVYQLSLKTPAGQTAPQPFTVDPFPRTDEQEPNDSPTTGQKVTLPASLAGALGRPGDVDFYRFEAQAGQQIGVQVVTAPDSKIEPVLKLTDGTGRTLLQSTRGVLGYTCPRAGSYALGIHDSDYRGGAGMRYLLHVGDIPVVSAVFPLGLQQGTRADVHVEGVHLGTRQTLAVQAPPTATPGTRLPVPLTTPLGTPLGNPGVVVGEFPEVVRTTPMPTIPVPGTANGRIDNPAMTETWRFMAKKGQRLILEVNARRLGSPLDSYLEVLDARGQLVERATLRCLARADTTFRDIDSAAPGIRLESWSELAVNDWIYIGNELIRIRALPRNPDDDCQFFGTATQRQAYLDTTPTHHSLGTPMYKVQIHPPGTSFPPNGLPVVHLPYRNDDGGPGYGKDSRLFFDPPADGEYQVRVGDARPQGGSSYAYRLTVRPPRPGFNISFNPTSPAVWKGGAVPVGVTADRIDGFDGRIDVRLENLPEGFSAPATSVPAEEGTTAFALYAEPTARAPAQPAPLKLVARASIDGREVVREVTGGPPRLLEPGDIFTTTEQEAVTVQPGGQVRVTVKIERRNGFAGRVPLDVRGLPHGTRVLDVGLNGILITPNETSRTFVIYAEPWVRPMAHPFVVLARREGKNTEFAARSVLLRVAEK